MTAQLNLRNSAEVHLNLSLLEVLIQKQESENRHQGHESTQTQKIL